MPGACATKAERAEKEGILKNRSSGYDVRIVMMRSKPHLYHSELLNNGVPIRI